MNKVFFRFLGITILAIFLFSKPQISNASFPMNDVINLLDVRFEGRTLRQIWFSDPNSVGYLYHCKTSRIVANYPPANGEETTVVGNVWFNAMEFIGNSIALNKPFYVSKNTMCIHTSYTQTLKKWVSSIRYIDYTLEFRNFIYFRSIDQFNHLWSRLNSSNSWCRARSVGSFTANKFFYNAVFRVPSTYLTFSSIDIVCTDNNKVVNVWLKNGWRKYSILS